MEQLLHAIRTMIECSEEEWKNYSSKLFLKTYKSKEVLSSPGSIPNEVFFIIKGILRVLISDKEGTEHTIHFAIENQFIADYSSFMLSRPSMYTLQAIEEVEVVVMPRAAIEWGYKNLKQGDKLGRLIAEFYFIYQDNRIKNLYARSPKERYETITEVFPGIHNRVPQHMIASYLGISPVHLSRLKNNKE